MRHSLKLGTDLHVIKLILAVREHGLEEWRPEGRLRGARYAFGEEKGMPWGPGVMGEF